MGTSHRRSASQLSADLGWQNVRRVFLTNHPWCEHCELLGWQTLATEADHIVRLCDAVSPAVRADPVGLQALCSEHHRKKSNWERGAMRFPLFLGTDAGGYNIELKRGFVETPERLSLFAEARLYRSAQSH